MKKLLLSNYLINYDTYYFQDLLSKDVGSKLYLITATFGHGRFSSEGWRYVYGEQRLHMLDKANCRLFDVFRGWYIRLLRACVPNFRARWMKKYHPRCIGYIDDRRDDSPRPHIHAIVWVPSQFVPAFEAWVGGPFTHLLRKEQGFKVGRAAIDWRFLEANGELHTREILTPHELRHTLAYAAKLYAKYSDRDAFESFRREYPDRT